MPAEIAIHSVTSLRVATHNRGNDNSLKLEFIHADLDGKPESLFVQTYSLPVDVTTKLLLAFGDAGTVDHSKIGEAA